MPLVTQRSYFAILVLFLFNTDLLAGEQTPNIVLIYADDLGYGDISCNGATAVNTPNIDRLAKEGLRFTDAHCSAATCTPSRYAMLTGSYAFRKQNSSVRSGAAKMVIEPGSNTLPQLLKTAGYTTGVVGKWHLGLGDGEIDWNGLVSPGPNEIGFDYHFLIPATGDRVPCVYVEQSRVVAHDPSDPIRVSYRKRIGDAPTGKERPDLLKQRWSHGHNGTIVNGISRIGHMTGGQSARWIDEDMADVISQKATTFIEKNSSKPFFLYFSTHDIHVPRVPHSRFVGKTDMGPRGDAIVQLDWCVGEVLNALDRMEITNNTLVIFSSDNGPVLDDGYYDESIERLNNHQPSGEFRAGKYSKFEGGTRVPLLARWPEHIIAGTSSDALVGQIDFPASLSALVGIPLKNSIFLDSRNQIEALMGQDPVGRPHLVHEANGLSLRTGKWKYVGPGNTRDGYGPWTRAKFKDGALYDLENDPGEEHDLSDEYPDKINNMQRLLRDIVEGRDSI